MTQSLLQVCRNCAHEFRIPDRLAGRKVNCPHCHRLIDVGGAAPAAAAEDRLVGKQLGGCKLTRRLGAGALGVVYEAEQVSMRRRVAVKMLSNKASSDEQLVQRFQREARICAQVQHPNVVAVFDCGFERGVHYLVMEYVEGTTLAGMIDEEGKLPWQQAAAVVQQVARGLDHVASQSIIHRDIKPANILVSAQGVAKLAALGMAKQTEGGAAESHGLTMQGVAMGSPAYMAPEQARNARDVTHAADIYSLGATFYHAVVGRPPFTGRSGAEVMAKVLREQPVPVKQLVPDIPQGIADLIDRMLAKDPAERPQDAAELIREIDEALAAPSQPRPLRRKVSTASTRRDQPQGGGVGLVVTVIIVAAALAAGAVWWFVLRKP